MRSCKLTNIFKPMTHLTQGWRIAKQRGIKSNRIPPFAPSLKEQEFYKKYLLAVLAYNKLPKRALILGATPELRDIAINVGLESIAVDISEEMMKKFSCIMRNQGSELDKRIINDWLEMDFPHNYFGAIMGDASFNNLVTKKDNEQLVSTCGNLLAKGGYLVLRQVLYAKNYKGYIDAKKVISDYRSGKIEWEDFFMELRINSFKNQVYSPDSFQYNAEKAFKLIDSLYDNKFLSQSEYESINTFRNNVINTFYPNQEFIRMIEKNNLKLIEEFHDDFALFFNYFYMVAFKKI